MKQIKIRDKNYNCSNAIYYHIQGLESENRLFNMEIKGHEQSELELSKRISKAIEYIETHQLNFKKGTTTFGSERLSMEERKLLDILRGEEDGRK